MAVSSKAAAMRPSGFLGLSVLAVALTIIVAVVLWQAVELSSVSRVSAQVEQIKPFASGVRLAIIGVVATLWPKWVRLVHRNSWVADDQRDDLLAQRWRVVGWLLVIELVLGQDLLGRSLATISGPVV